jgi:AcrR family transcriptional regulator
VRRKKRERATPKARPGYHHGNLRAALIQGGLELIEEKGIRALTLREIGTRLGVSRTAPYRHFKDKTDLLSAISQAAFVDFGNVIEAAKKSAVGGFAAQMDAMAMAYVRFANEHRAQYEVMYAALIEGGGSAEGSGRGFVIVEETIREAQLRGEVRPDDPALLTRVFWALVHGASMLRMDRDVPEPEFIRFSGEMLRSGLSERQTPAVSPQAAEVKV